MINGVQLKAIILSKHAVLVPASQKWRDKLVTQEIAGHLREFCNVLMECCNLKTGEDIEPAIDELLSFVDFILLLWWSNSTDQPASG